MAKSGDIRGERVGLWLVGACGGVGTTVAVGLAGLASGIVGEEGLVTALPVFGRLRLARWSDFVVGGHEIRRGGWMSAARRMEAESGYPPGEVVRRVSRRLKRWEKNLRAGTAWCAGAAVEALAERECAARGRVRCGRDLVGLLRRDLREFREREGARRLVVINVASTEAAGEDVGGIRRWEDLDRLLGRRACPVPASVLYAVAAAAEGACYLNFTPSVGCEVPAVVDLAERSGGCVGGSDGKTGETLVKSVLAPMFAMRNLKVMSWAGTNVLGNLDAAVLTHAAHGRAKLASKDRVVGEILGREVETAVTIQHVRSLGDWKTAWDHIHFRGFLGAKMAMQFVWQGCDSALAAPLVLDLARLGALALKRGERGVLGHLAFFFKRPMGGGPADLFRQWEMLMRYVEAAEAPAGGRRR